MLFRQIPDGRMNMLLKPGGEGGELCALQLEMCVGVSLRQTLSHRSIFCSPKVFSSFRHILCMVFAHPVCAFEKGNFKTSLEKFCACSPLCMLT